MSKLSLCDTEPRVEPRRLAPVVRVCLGQAHVGCDYRPHGLRVGAEFAESALRGALVRLLQVVGEAVRNLADVEPPRRGRDLLRVLVQVGFAARTSTRVREPSYARRADLLPSSETLKSQG